MKNYLIILAAMAFIFSGCQMQENSNKESKDDSFEKYGQEFHGKVAKSYEESEEWWPSSPKPPEGTPYLISPVMDARSASLPSIFGALSPGMPFSRMKPRILSSSVLAQTTKTSAMGLLVIHILAPLSW